MRSYVLGVATGIALIAASGSSYRAGYRRGVVATDSVFAVSRAGASLLRVNSDGKVGIGTIDPQARLHVTGAVRADGEVYTSTGGFRYPNDDVRTVAPYVYTVSATAASSLVTETIAVCNRGDVVTGGGYQFVYPPFSLRDQRPDVIENERVNLHPGIDGWRVEIVDAFTGFWTVTVHCARGVS